MNFYKSAKTYFLGPEKTEEPVDQYQYINNLVDSARQLTLKNVYIALIIVYMPRTIQFFIILYLIK